MPVSSSQAFSDENEPDQKEQVQKIIEGGFLDKLSHFTRRIIDPLAITLLVVGLIPNLVLPLIFNAQGYYPSHIISGSMNYPEKLKYTETALECLGYKSHSEVPRSAGFDTHTVLLINRKIVRNKLKKCEVVAFLTANDKPPTTHRIIEVIEAEDSSGALNTWYKTQGDNVEDPDKDLVNDANVVGVVVADLNDFAGGILPWGFIYQICNSVLARIIFFGPVCFLFLSQWIIGMFGLDSSGRLRKKKREIDNLQGEFIEIGNAGPVLRRPKD